VYQKLGGSAPALLAETLADWLWRMPLLAATQGMQRHAVGAAGVNGSKPFFLK